MGLSKEKIRLSVQLYELIEETLQELDSDLKKYETELKKHSLEMNSEYKEELKSDVSLSKKSKIIRKDLKFSSNYKMKHQSHSKLMAGLENSQE